MMSLEEDREAQPGAGHAPAGSWARASHSVSWCLGASLPWKRHYRRRGSRNVRRRRSGTVFASTIFTSTTSLPPQVRTKHDGVKVYQRARAAKPGHPDALRGEARRAAPAQRARYARLRLEPPRRRKLRVCAAFLDHSSGVSASSF